MPRIRTFVTCTLLLGISGAGCASIAGAYLCSKIKVAVSAQVVDDTSEAPIPGATLVMRVTEGNRLAMKERELARSDPSGSIEYISTVNWGQKLGPIERARRNGYDGIVTVIIEKEGYDLHTVSFPLSEIYTASEAFPMNLGTVHLVRSNAES